MAYSIQYDGQIEKRFYKRKKYSPNMKRLMILSIVVLLAAVWAVTPVRVAVLDSILPGNGAVTRRAAGTMFDKMRNGENFKEAFSDFCIEIFENS